MRGAAATPQQYIYVCVCIGIAYIIPQQYYGAGGAYHHQPQQQQAHKQREAKKKKRATGRRQKRNKNKKYCWHRHSITVSCHNTIMICLPLVLRQGRHDDDMAVTIIVIIVALGIL